MPTRLLVEQGHDITAFYANSNIAPRGEYEKRLRELQRYASDRGFDVLEGHYDPGAWEREVAPIGEALKDFSPAFRARVAGEGAQAGGAEQEAPDAKPASAAASSPQTVAELLDDENRRERCRACYRLRLEEAARVAVAGGYDGLATTLAVSPYQFTDVIREELERACNGTGVVAHFQDYRPYYDEATRISRELGMYRQNYCGCRFSLVEGEATRAFLKLKRAEEKEARAKERAAVEAARQHEAAEKRAEKQAHASERARRRAILKQMRGR